MQPVRNAALMYISAYVGNKQSFFDTYKFLMSLGISESNAFKYTLRAKKGMEDTSKPGAFLKDSLYFTGYLRASIMTDEDREALIKNGKTHEFIDL